MPELICSSVGTHRYLRVGGSQFVLDAKLEDDFRARCFDKSQLLQMFFKLGQDLCGPSFVQQPGDQDIDQEFKLSFYFFGDPAKGFEQGSDIVWSQFNKRMRMFGKSHLIIMCEEFKYNQTIKPGQTLFPFCFSLTRMYVQE